MPDCMAGGRLQGGRFQLVVLLIVRLVNGTREKVTYRFIWAGSAYRYLQKASSGLHNED
jgi:hypothetical protein